MHRVPCRAPLSLSKERFRAQALATTNPEEPQNDNEPCDTASQSATCELDCTLPTCGDGTLNPAANETCDDHNTQDGDGCTADCQSLERFVFVTSASYKGDLNNEDPEQSANPDGLTGLALSDYRCQTLATKASLPGTYKAWLSTDTESPSTRFDKSFTGLYRLPGNDFPIVANGWNALTSASLSHPINANETAKLTEDNVFTNTLPDGTSASDLDCTKWSMKGNTATAIGQSSASDDTWTRIELAGICSGSNRLYCFQDL